ncbi:hypothetical protein FVER14953_20108 [Fusarium verticillioides]|nr:hypothetical protein FVER14953_20108 [Fusarium verticillioides]
MKLRCRPLSSLTLLLFLRKRQRRPLPRNLLLRCNYFHILITTSSPEPTTLATSTAEPTTTTTAATDPTDVLTDPGFDSDSIAPWYTLGGRGTLSITDEDTHSGDFSGHFYTDGFISPVVLGVDHTADQSLIKAYTEYHYSIWTKTAEAVNCNMRRITGRVHFEFRLGRAV